MDISGHSSKAPLSTKVAPPVPSRAPLNANRRSTSFDAAVLPPLPPKSSVPRETATSEAFDAKAISIDTPPLTDTLRTTGSEASRNTESSLSDSPPTTTGTSAITLRELDQNYSNSFPLTMLARTGYYGRNSDVEISNGETLHVHLRKTREIVTALDSASNFFGIPINSGCRFSLIQNVSYPTAVRRYESVRKLASAVPMPKVVSCTRAWSNGSTVLQEGEILVVKGNIGNDGLEVLSLRYRVKKILLFCCEAEFSTDPSLTSMYLSDIIDHVSDPFPSKALIHNVEAIIGTKYVTLLKSSSEVTLLCSSLSSNTRFELPIDLPGVLVSVVDMISDTQQAQLYEHHQDIMSTYNPAYGVTVCRDDCTRSVYDLILKISGSVREGYEMRGIDIQVSPTTSVMPDCPLSTVPEVVQGCENLYAEIDEIQEISTEAKRRANRKLLSTMSEEKVIEMLHKMQLDQYIAEFRNEYISGAIMCELNEEILEKELCIHSKLHRIRLMKVVQGETDARLLLS